MPLPALLLAAVAALHLGLGVWLRWGWRRVVVQAAPQQTGLPPATIVVCARNEAANLEALLPLLAAQQGLGAWQLLVANDRSTDGTAAVLAAWQARLPQLTVLEVPPPPEGQSWAGKKWAMQCAVGAARHGHILCTDADCRPGPRWAATLLAQLPASQAVSAAAVGYSPYQRARGRWLHAAIQAETLHTALLYLGAAGAGHPYMAVGRNLAYTRAFWQRGAAALARHSATPSGDDDLLLNAAAPGSRVVAVALPEATVPTLPAGSIGAWFRQKTRHMGASRHYPLGVRAGLGLWHGSLAGVWAGALAVALLGHADWAVGILAGCSVLKSAIFAGPVRVLRGGAAWWLWPVLDVFICFYPLLPLLLSYIYTPEWKTPSAAGADAPRKTAN